MNNSASIFRALHQQSTLLILPNAWDAASARIFEDLGAPAVATTSAGVAWSLGYADGVKMPVKALALVAQNITRVIKVPLSIDFENGYSDIPAQVAENIKPLLDAGVAGINIEDGNDAPDLLAAKIEAIRKVTDGYGADLFINARTDVYLASLAPPEKRISEVSTRSRQYAAAGADGIFVPFLSDEHEIKQIVDLVNLPLNVLSVPTLSGAGVLTHLGVKRLSAGSGIFQMICENAALLAKKFLQDGDSSSLAGMPYATLQELFARSA